MIDEMKGWTNERLQKFQELCLGLIGENRVSLLETRVASPRTDTEREFVSTVELLIERGVRDFAC